MAKFRVPMFCSRETVFGLKETEVFAEMHGDEASNRIYQEKQAEATERFNARLPAVVHRQNRAWVAV